MGAEDRFAGSAMGAEHTFLACAKKLLAVWEVEIPKRRSGQVDSTQVQRERKLTEIAMPASQLGNESQGDFFGVDPKKVPLFSAPKKAKKVAPPGIRYTSTGT